MSGFSANIPTPPSMDASRIPPAVLPARAAESVSKVATSMKTAVGQATESAVAGAETASARIVAFLQQFWIPVVCVAVVVALGAGFWLIVHHYPPAIAWWASVTGKTVDDGSSITLPRAENATIKAYETRADGSVVEVLPNGSGKPVKYETDLDATATFGKPPVKRPGDYSDENEVFNVSNNIFTYADAPAVCKAFDAKLATAKQVEDAHKEGADWCNYGWTQGQMALYPTQQATIDRLKKIKGHEHDCGREGVNGGYFANPDLEFGVNCYGKKPKPRAEEKALIGYFPDYVSEEELRLQERVAEIKKAAGDLTITPFSRTEWDAHRNVFEKAEDWVREEYEAVKEDIDPTSTDEGTVTGSAV